MSNKSTTTLEIFPPEIFLEIFSYMNGYDNYKSFYGLNHRLSTLVSTYGMRYIDISETTFNESRKMFSVINCSHVNSLILSNEYYDEQIDQILDNSCFLLNSMVSLNALTLDSIGLYTMYTIAHQHFQLDNLKTLIISFRSDLCVEKVSTMYRGILYSFCSRFKSLKYLILSASKGNEIIYRSGRVSLNDSLSSTQISSTLQRLFLRHIRINDIENILSRFPKLQCLSANVRLNRHITDYPLSLNLIACDLPVGSSKLELLVNLLKQCPNVKQLTLYFSPKNYDELDSYKWEDLIEKYLLKLKQFTLYILLFYMEMDIAQALIENNFLQNQFWLDRKTKIEIIDGESTDNDDIKTKIMIKFSI
ncbi:unnamed protein product [Adineta steineri]|uniref:F-box domain-containing protein n=1 Tax=Adineta steineri TaxID=433720 RepID=A0A819IQJ2_9BILA|nr:unnamed protein product [Adineta steineri]CAF3917332.1 unnamed protein product [Adineta steineri]